jgi:hypothetical protein
MDQIFSTVATVAVFGFVLVLFMLFILKPEVIIRLFRLTKGFDNEHIDFGQLNASEIVKISVLILGGITIINNFPTFIIQTYNAFAVGINENVIAFYSKPQLIISIINLTIGYLLIKNYSFIDKILNKKNKDITQLND